MKTILHCFLEELHLELVDNIVLVPILVGNPSVSKRVSVVLMESTELERPTGKLVLRESFSSQNQVRHSCLILITNMKNDFFFKFQIHKTCIFRVVHG